MRPNRIPIATDLLSEGRPVLFPVRGWSMWPTLRPDDVILVEPIAKAGLQPGDIILCRWGESWLVHRVVKRFSDPGGSWIQTQGDANGGPDAPCPESDVQGKVVAAERKGRSLSLASPWPKGLARLVYKLLRLLNNIDLQVILSLHA